MPASYEVTEWIAADGTVVNLMEFVEDQVGVAIQPGRKGAFMPPVRRAEDNIPYANGSRVKYQTLGPREVDFPFFIKGTSEDDLRLRLRALLSRFNPLDDAGRIRVTRPDGTRRELICRYQQGMELVEDDRNYGVTYAKAIATFRANDPIWYDVDPISSTYSSGAEIPFFPGTPFRLTSNAIFATVSGIVNDGDVDAWPVWIIQGPGTDIALRNDDTGEKLEFTSDVELATGESITIDTREGLRTVKLNDGTRLYSKLTGDSQMWPIYRGTNNIRIDMQNTTTESLVTLSYYRGYLSV